MMKLSERSRKVLRAIYKGLGVTAVSLVFHSCPIGVETGWGAYGMPAAYGMPPDYVQEELCIRGQVRAKINNYKPIKGIAVVIDGINNNYPYTTSSFGEFSIWVPKREKYTIILTDVDGDRNGGRFKQIEISLTEEEAQALYEEPLFIDLEPETEIINAE